MVWLGFNESELKIVLRVVAPFETQIRNLLGETEENRAKKTVAGPNPYQRSPEYKEEIYPLSCDDR
jgi:hypothetical protein